MTPRPDTARAFGMSGNLIGPVTFAGETFHAVVAVDQDEVARRSEAGLGAVTDRDVLRLLSELPASHPVAVDELEAWNRVVLEAVPSGVIDVIDGAAVRRWRPAIRVGGVLIAGRRWHTAIQAASWFWCDAHRAAVLDQMPSSIEHAIRRARHFGVGLAVDDGRVVHVLAPTAPPTVTPNARHWRFLEACYDAWLSAQPSLSQARR